MWQLKRTHLFPDMGNANAGGLEKKRTVNVEELSRNAELHRLARVFGWHNEELVDNFDETRRQIRRLHNEIYYRPMLPISAVSGDERVELSEQAVMDRYAAIGFADRRRRCGMCRRSPPASPVPRRSMAYCSRGAALAR